MINHDIKYKTSYKHSDITEKIIKVFYIVYNRLGHGFLEKVYENSMMLELKNFGLKCNCQYPITVY
jgi:GxxExxY protein